MGKRQVKGKREGMGKGEAITEGNTVCGGRGRHAQTGALRSPSHAHPSCASVRLYTYTTVSIFDRIYNRRRVEPSPHKGGCTRGRVSASGGCLLPRVCIREWRMSANEGRGLLPEPEYPTEPRSLKV